MIQLLTADQIRRIHDRILFEGELRGEYKERPVEAVLGRIENRINYGIEVNDLFDIAGCYGAFIAIAHAFVDGNKRTAFRTVAAFMGVNGLRVEFGRPDRDPLFELIIQCATNNSDEIKLAAHLRTRYVIG